MDERTELLETVKRQIKLTTYRIRKENIIGERTLQNASAATTINLYAHAQEGQKRAASDLMGNLLNHPCKESSKVVSL
jgi:hypothetical protein